MPNAPPCSTNQHIFASWPDEDAKLYFLIIPSWDKKLNLSEEKH
jgi:hypothetical protein